MSEIDGRISWSADHLAIVANKSEAAGFLNNRESLDPEVLAQKLREKYNAEVIVVKCGALGAVVLDSGGTQRVPAYYTNKINPIGSGDIFTSVFAFYWAEMRANPITAAENASKATAEWVMNGPLQVINFNTANTELDAFKPSKSRNAIFCTFPTPTSCKGEKTVAPKFVSALLHRSSNQRSDTVKKGAAK